MIKVGRAKRKNIVCVVGENANVIERIGATVFVVAVLAICALGPCG